MTTHPVLLEETLQRGAARPAVRPINQLSEREFPKVKEKEKGDGPEDEVLRAALWPGWEEPEEELSGLLSPVEESVSSQTHT